MERIWVCPHFAVTTSGAAQPSHPPHPRQKLRPHALARAAFPGRGAILQQNLDKQRAHGVVVSHPLSMREALGSIPSVSILHFGRNIIAQAKRWTTTFFTE